MTTGRSFSRLSKKQKAWLDAYLDGSIEAEDFAALQDGLLESAELRTEMRRYLALDDSLRNIGSDGVDLATSPWLNLQDPAQPDARLVAEKKVVRFPSLLPVAAAAMMAFFLGSSFMYWQSRSDVVDGNGSGRPLPANDDEPSAQGFAVVGRLFDATWADESSAHREGDTLGAEIFQLAAGTAEIRFFSGATMTLEGPAEISLKSAWEASCSEGSVRMNVPPAARGFTLQAPGSEIVDLGTEFGLEVRDGRSHVEVFDGEIALRHGDEDEQLVKKGAALSLASGAPSVAAEVGRVVFPNVDNFGSRAVDEQRQDFLRWRQHRDHLAENDGLIAYYDFDRADPLGLIPNLTVPENPELDGAVVLAEPVDGRWPGMKPALEFRRPGARVRVKVAGEFSAFTFACWVRIDSLDRWYNALFMADSYETGEPHWQIRNDGSMMLSIMVDDSRKDPKNPDGPPIRFQHLYFSPPMWDTSMSGQWLHLASVFDPQGRQVSHYVNGERISRESIRPQHWIDTLRIGNAEIGNWGQPFREDPTFAIRNLNGRMDEIAVFGVALGDEEIVRLYETSRVGGRRNIGD